MKASSVAWLLLVSVSAFAENDATSIAEGVRSCWDLQSRLGQESCLAEIGEELEIRRNHLRDQRIELVYNSGLKEQILSASEEWMRFRESECSVVKDQFESASLQNAKVMECEIYFTVRRVEELQHYVDCTQNGCPWFF